MCIEAASRVDFLTCSTHLHSVQVRQVELSQGFLEAYNEMRRKSFGVCLLGEIALVCLRQKLYDETQTIAQESLQLDMPCSNPSNAPEHSLSVSLSKITPAAVGSHLIHFCRLSLTSWGRIQHHRKNIIDETQTIAEESRQLDVP